MRRLGLLALVVAASMIVAAGGNPGPGVSPSGEILFSRSSDRASSRPSDLYLARPDGSHVRLLVRDGEDAAVSPSGRLVAFVRDGAIWVMNRNTSNQHPVTRPLTRPTPKGQFPAAIDGSPAWSGDGRTIYFGRFVMRNGTESLYSVGVDGKRLRRLTFPEPTEDTHCHTDPSPSPTGDVFAFADWTACDHGTDSTIAGLTDAGRHMRLPFRFPTVRVVADPAWAPNGRLIAFRTGDVDAWGGAPETLPDAIYISSSDGSQPRRVPHTNGLDNSPAWSPDSEWIVFSRRNDNDNEDIWRVRRDGTDLQHVTRGKEDDFAPTWLPPAS